MSSLGGPPCAARIEALENPGFQAAVAAGLADLGWQRVQVYTEW